MVKIAILTMPDAPFLGYLLQELKERNVDVSCLVYDKKEFSKKDRQIHEQRTKGRLPILNPNDLCDEINVFNVENHNDDDCIEYIKNNKFDLLVNCESPRILNTSLIAAASIGILNCHPGLLPAYRGCSCVEWAVFNNDPVANTIHFVSEGIDEGDIIKSKVVDVRKDDDYVDLRVKVYMEGVKLMASVIENYYFFDGSGVTQQDEQKAGYYKPIDNEKLNKVIEKLKNGSYVFQI
jgi:methionyl-tRNA formyltransferase